MPFFDQDGPGKVTEFDLKCAGLLITTVNKHTNFKRKYSKKVWAVAFCELRLRIGADRLRTALDFYIRHFNGDFIPKAYSAKGFAEKFERIEEAMRRQPISVLPSRYLADA